MQTGERRTKQWAWLDNIHCAYLDKTIRYCHIYDCLVFRGLCDECPLRDSDYKNAEQLAKIFGIEK